MLHDFRKQINPILYVPAPPSPPPFSLLLFIAFPQHFGLQLPLRLHILPHPPFQYKACAKPSNLSQILMCSVYFSSPLASITSGLFLLCRCTCPPSSKAPDKRQGQVHSCLGSLQAESRPWSPCRVIQGRILPPMTACVFHLNRRISLGRAPNQSPPIVNRSKALMLSA